ncbi:hypothetical protein T265_00566 [Opisthorchis viverrini]|uniref:EF-hand domain-containing protein n=1 Tax=Opisthorchis viverrini TaxID=6198 RepID=A0A075AJN3_OPIVI|nr:hypothetical protein T265_00566 [Opisthorchis viverrini]KER33684.1 hypothetical protein T265_00566 [Opisthorchis viverrini]
MSAGPGGPVWTRKMRTLFRRLDAQGHGYLMVDDLLEVATHIFGVYPKMEAYKNDYVVRTLVYLWYQVMCIHVDRHVATMTNVNEATFVDNMLKATSGPFKEQFSENFVDPLFDAMDQDDDKMITAPEYTTLMVALKATQRDSEVLFKQNADGNKLSKSRFEEVMRDYFFGDDSKSKCNKLWGPLLEYKRAEDFGTLDCGPVWEGKMRTMFRRLDVGESMRLRCHDLLHIGQFLIQRGHLDKKKADSVLRYMMHIWVKYLAVDKDGAHLPEIREIEFIHNLRDMINGDYRHEIDQFGWTLFKAVEVDNSGFITQTQYRNLQEAWHVGRDEAEGMFKILDTNKDGKISSDEFLTAWNDYFLGEDPQSPYRMFFGPIISRQTEAK